VIWGFHEVQSNSAGLMLDPRRLAIRAARFEPEADWVIWTVSQTASPTRSGTLPASSTRNPTSITTGRDIMTRTQDGSSPKIP
jgi:hypothetical protein